MAIIPAFGDPPPASAIVAAVSALEVGAIVALPTDTVYGLAADPFRTGAADRIFSVKGRPRSVELPVLVADIEQALGLAVAVTRSAELLMEKFWPGGLTIVLPRSAGLAADLGETSETVGVRCPSHPVPLAICRALGPIATTSANKHGEPPVTRADLIEKLLGPQVELILDAGICDALPSTVVDCTGDQPKLLREGSISWDEVCKAVTSVDCAD